MSDVDAEIDDLLGVSKAAGKVKKRILRPRKPRATTPHPNLGPAPPPRAKAAGVVNGVSSTTTAAAEIVSGVTVFWLAKAFGMEVSTVRKRLADCPTVGRKTSGYLYSLPVAAAYLVKPRVDIKAYLEQMRPQDLPAQLQVSYWDAKIKQQRWESSARHLWHTEDVIEVLSEVFKTIKFTLQLWPETLERTTALKEEDREVLVRLADELQDELYEKMKEMAAERSTPHSLRRLEESDNEGPDDGVEDVL